MSQRAPRVPANEARQQILAAARELLLDRPFAALTVGDVMTRAGLTRTVFYRHFDGLPQLEVGPRGADDRIEGAVYASVARRPRTTPVSLLSAPTAVRPE